MEDIKYKVLFLWLSLEIKEKNHKYFNFIYSLTKDKGVYPEKSAQHKPTLIFSSCRRGWDFKPVEA